MSLLTMENITKVFPGVVANDSINFNLEAGEIHALVGENGAGKTTLMKILYGLHKPDHGRILVSDTEIQIKNPKDAINRGIGMVHQHFMLVPPFNAVENIVLGEESHRGGVLRFESPNRRIRELIVENGLEVNLDIPVEELPVGLQQRVEILKILYRGAEILVFDEPTAVLTPREVKELFATFRRMTEQGRGIVFISHKLDEVIEIADRITVIRRGCIIQTMKAKEATKPKLAESMVGKPVLFKVENPPSSPAHSVLSLRNLSLRGEKGNTTLDKINIDIAAGEIYGIAGVEGNGQTELVKAIAEDTLIEEGEILLNGKNLAGQDVRNRREAGISHIPEDRHRYGLLLPFSLADNMVLGMHHRPPYVGKAQIRDTSRIRENARQLIKSYDIRTPSETSIAGSLSGGNQQKVIIAREMSFDPKLLLASQPTRGVDVGATEFIYKQLIEAKKNGRAVLLVSADLDEVISLSDRIGVIYKGSIVREFRRGEATKEEIGYYMTGAESKQTESS
ncbi:MAG: ABC transporter ATP-binding protein [Spirochaetales bacterium]|nr:ABC transporter ATP-binding protein [Spirochaetales bacterium]